MSSIVFIFPFICFTLTTADKDVELTWHNNFLIYIHIHMQSVRRWMSMLLCTVCVLTSEYAVVMCSYKPWWWWIVSSRSWSSEGNSPSPHALHHGSTLLMYWGDKMQQYYIKKS